MEKTEFLANVKEVRVKTLVSGDKETRIVLSVVGADLVNANRLTDLPPEIQVKVTF